jgi:hypothetical protein
VWRHEAVAIHICHTAATPQPAHYLLSLHKHLLPLFAALGWGTSRLPCFRGMHIARSSVVLRGPIGPPTSTGTRGWRAQHVVLTAASASVLSLWAAQQHRLPDFRGPGQRHGARRLAGVRLPWCFWSSRVWRRPLPPPLWPPCSTFHPARLRACTSQSLPSGHAQRVGRPGCPALSFLPQAGCLPRALPNPPLCPLILAGSGRR